MSDIYLALMDHPNGFMAFCDETGEFCLDVSVRYSNSVVKKDLMLALGDAYRMVVKELEERLADGQERC